MNMLIAQIFGLAVSINDICPRPVYEVAGGDGFCIIEEEQLIETPYFVVTISPRVLVWLDDNGRTLVIESSVRQSQISIGITVNELDPGHIPETMQAAGCPDVKILPRVK